MRADYVQKGDSIDYINTGGEVIFAGTVIVLGRRVGVAGCDIAPESFGSVHTAGVFRITKAASASGFNIGDIVYYDEAGAATSGDAEIGWAAEASPAGIADVKVKIG